MIKRKLSEKIINLSKKFPSVTITGPRQSGKTTLVKDIFKNYAYISLEDPDEREFAISDPKGFLKRFSSEVILDEIQRTPVLLSYIQGIIDKEYVPGKFIITGSNQFYLMKNITQTLAGRTAIVNLLPFSLTELLEQPAINLFDLTDLTDIGYIEDIYGKSDKSKYGKPPLRLEEYLFKGFYPPIHDKQLEPKDWLSAYYRTYVERDVREITNIGNIETFYRFIQLCAGRCGQILNLSSLASDAGISHTTAKNWISVLQASFILYVMPPHLSNFSKRIIKSPKLYFLDTGLLCYLLRIRKAEDILFNSMKGQIFENFVFLEFYKFFANIGEIPPLYFWRDRTGHEIDFIIDTGKKLIPVEAKSGETVANSFFDGLNYFKSLDKDANISKTGILINGGDVFYIRNGNLAMPWYYI
ncbi:MAG: ATP-binding protein [Deltaproteobacteria bacterium]|nr:ATP-binding protein [Deltaproteobacteria bacterium]